MQVSSIKYAKEPMRHDASQQMCCKRGKLATELSW